MHQLEVGDTLHHLTKSWSGCKSSEHLQLPKLTCVKPYAQLQNAPDFKVHAECIP